MISIQPTPGRVLWYYPSKDEKTGLHLPFLLHGEGPLAASIAHINPNGTLNLGVLDSSGNHHSRQGIVLVQDGEDVPAEDAYATWMPYQVGQATKTEQVQQQLVQQAQQQAGAAQGSGDPAPAADIAQQADSAAAALQQPVGDAQSEYQVRTTA